MPSFEAIQDEIQNMLAISEDELDEEHKQLMDQYLDMLADQESGKVDSFASFLKLQTEYAECMEAEAARLKTKAKNIQKKLDWLKCHYRDTMMKYGVQKIVGKAYTLSLKKSEIVYVDEHKVDTLPEEYQRKKVLIEPDKMAIKNALKTGCEISGCALVTKYSLNIR